jgi:hypothetical protein
LGLLVVSALLSGGALFIKYKLEGLQTSIQELAESRTGAQFTFSSINLAGLTGLRIENLEVDYVLDAGPHARVMVPSARVSVDLVDLISGRFSISHVQLNGAAVIVERPIDARWYPSPAPRNSNGKDWLAGDLPFRISGNDCTLDIANIVGGTRLHVDDIRFDVAKQGGAGDLIAQVYGNLDNDAKKQADVRVLYSSREDFDLVVVCEGIAAGDVNIFLPASQQLVESGIVRPKIRVDKFPGQPITVQMNAPFENLYIRNQPEFLAPASGTFTLSAQYDPEQASLEFATAKAISEDIDGTLDGTISFAGSTPLFDLRFEASQVPIMPIVEDVLADRVDQYGQLDVTLEEPTSVRVNLAGSSEEPKFSASVNIAGAQISFDSRVERWPDGNLRLGPTRVAWDSEGGEAVGQCTILDGSAIHRPTDMEASNFAGTFTLADSLVKTEALSGNITDLPFVASGEYQLRDRRGSFELSGGLAEMESTPLANRIKKTRLAGSASLRCTGTIEPDEYTAIAEVDLTQANVGYSWWFEKAAGIGATGTVDIHFKPGQSFEVDTRAELASSQFQARSTLGQIDGRWRLLEAKATSDHVDVNAMGRCVRVPYKIAGGVGTSAHYSWKRIHEGPDTSIITYDCQFDELAITPEGGNEPFFLQGGVVEGNLTQGSKARAELTLHIENGKTPVIGDDVWFINPRLNDPFLELYPKEKRVWTFNLGADALEVPPWKGTHFRGEGFYDNPYSGLNSFRADIDGGHIEGQFRSEGDDNLAETHAKWTNVPAFYVLDYLKMDRGVTGRMTGEVTYSLDRDDPSTRKGHGSFDIIDGQFSADFLIARLVGSIGEDVEAIPASLEFTSLSGDVEMESDIVRTPRLSLVAEALQVEGRGEFVTDGDMSYQLDVSISPKAAEQIKPLRDALNLQGHKISQQNIDLAFELNGPLFNPQGQVLGGPPVSVAVVSGLTGITSDVIDIPRQILVDLLKLGGGIVNATK